jgi:hypothetical protein
VVAHEINVILEFNNLLQPRRIKVISVKSFICNQTSKAESDYLKQTIFAAIDIECIFSIRILNQLMKLTEEMWRGREVHRHGLCSELVNSS